MKFISKYRYFLIVFILFLLIALLTFKNVLELRTILFLDTKIHKLTFAQNNMIVQRSDSITTSVNFSGRVGVLADEIEGAIIEDSMRIVNPNTWKKLSIPSITSFSCQLALKEGINKIFLRSIKNIKSERSPRQFNVVKIGIGEVFIIAGQSNASGGSKTLFCSNTGNVFCGQLQEDKNFIWKNGDDPQVAGGGGSVWPLVGDSLSKLLQLPIGFINVAVGSSSINDWGEGSKAYNDLINAIESCGPNGARAILWHQGETDIYMPSEEYYEKLSSLIKLSQTKMHKPIPWMVSTATFQLGKMSEGIRNAQKMIVKEGLALEGPDTDSLKFAYREPIDKVHYNEKGTIAASNLWITALNKAIYNKQNYK